MSGLLNSSRPTTAQIVGGVYSAVAPAPVDGQAVPLQFDNEGNLLVNVAVGGGGGSVTSKIEDSNGNPLLSNGAGALKVDGSLVTQPVSGSVAVTNFPATQPVSGSVSVSNFPATQPVSGSVSVSNFPVTQPVSAVSLPLPSNAAQETGGNLATLAGTVTAAKVGVTVSNFPTTQPVSGTVAVSNFPATQPVSGTVSLGAGAAVIGHVIADSGSTTAVTGNVTVVQPTGSNLHTVVDTLPALVAGTAVIGHVINDASTAVIGHVIADTGSTTAVTGNVTVVQPTGSSLHTVVDTLPALVAGSALIGKVGIDQTTPGTTNAVQDASDGPVTAGTAASKSSLGGGVVATAAASGTAGQQLATQLDSKGNQRVNATGQTGSFTSVTATGAGNASVVLTVPAATKWRVKSVLVSVTSASGTKTGVELVGNDSGGTAFAIGVLPVSFTGNNNIVFAPSVATSTSFTNSAATAGFPELSLGPSATLIAILLSGLVTDTVKIVANVESYPD